MIADGCTSFTEVGPGQVLQGMVKKIDRAMATSGINTFQG
jgi:[acyl-carrier-protein] S-malonyltransferase